MADREHARWQARLMPIMSLLVVATAVFFAIVSVVEFNTLQTRMLPSSPPPEINWPDSNSSSTFEQKIQLSQLKAAFALEKDLITLRYQQTSIAVTGRLWTRFMGFTTGMLLSLVGAAFVLGRLREPATELQGAGETTGQKLTFTLRSASPGLILAILGTLLMALSIVVPTTVETIDRPTYFGTSSLRSLEPPPLGAATPDTSVTTENHAKSAPP